MDGWMDAWIDGLIDRKRWTTVLRDAIHLSIYPHPSIHPSTYQAEKAIEAQLQKLEAKKKAKGC